MFLQRYEKKWKYQNHLTIFKSLLDSYYPNIIFYMSEMIILKKKYIMGKITIEEIRKEDKKLLLKEIRGTT